MPLAPAGALLAKIQPWLEKLPPSSDVFVMIPPGPFVTSVVLSRMSMFAGSEKSLTMVPGVPGSTLEAELTFRSCRMKTPPAEMKVLILGRLLMKVEGSRHCPDSGRKEHRTG
jgi:hypothetical protein